MSLCVGGVSYWVLNYCRRILFGRRVLHKIHSTFRPPLAVHNGVGMGRAFSVLLFCIAMDPWYCHGHQIPRVLINRSCMDDNATNGSGLEWLFNAQTLFQKFSEAGFVVLSHECYTVECIPEPPYQPPCFLPCEPVTNGFPSLWAALPPILRPSYMRICSGSRCIILHSSLLSFFPILHAKSTLIFFLSSILQHVNVSARPFSFRTLLSLPLTSPYSTPWGCKIISPSMLGLFLHPHSPNPLPCMMNRCRTIEVAQLRKPIATMLVPFLTHLFHSYSTPLGSSPLDSSLPTSWHRYLPPPWHSSLPSHPSHLFFTRLLFALLW